jgi:sugar lactone lactonase YvrE
VAAPAPAVAGAQPAAQPASPKAVVKYTDGLSTPESVLYDAEQDRYLVSNINGSPVAADNNGYIAVLSPDGKLTQAKFIAGGVNKVKLDAPKGTGIAKGTLYVADITVVRKFDVHTGAPLGDIKIPGAMFLNDIVVSSDDKVYVSDSGLKPQGDGLGPAGADAVYVIEKGKVKTVAKSKDLGNPNGLAIVGNELVVVTFGSDEAYRLNDKGQKQDVTKLPGGGLDGIVVIGDELLVSSWQASAVFRGKLGGKFEVAVPGLKSPADIGYDTKRKRLLVPHFTENSVEVFDLP